MNTEHVKGGLNELKGSVKQGVGKAIGNASLEGKGFLDRLKGKFQQGLGELKDAVRKNIDARKSSRV